MAEEIFNFFKQEVLWNDTVQRQQLHYHHVAATRVNLVAQAMGVEATKTRLLPFLNDILADSRAEPAFVHSLSSALASGRGSGMLFMAPRETLELVWNHLAASVELTTRTAALTLMEDAIAILSAQEEAVLKSFFDTFISASVVGDLSKTPYLRTVAALNFCAICKRFLGKEDLERLGRHPSPFVRIALCKAVGAFEELPLADLAESLLNDKDDSVVIAALQNRCLGVFLNREENTNSFEILCSNLCRHASYKIRMESSAALRAVAESSSDIGEETVFAIVRALEERLQLDSQLIVKREALLQITSAKLLLQATDPVLLTKTIAVLESDRGAGLDGETRMSVAKACVNIFLLNRTLITLDTMLLQLERFKTDAQVHLFITDSLLSESLLLTIEDEDEKALIIKRVYESLEGEISWNQNLSVDVTCWRSNYLAFSRSVMIIKSVGSLNIWLRKCGGLEFLKDGMRHPCYSVGVACTIAVEEILDECVKGGEDEFILPDVLPMVAELSNENISVPVLLMCGKLLGFLVRVSSSKEVIDGIHTTVGDIAIKAMASKALRVRYKAASLGAAVMNSLDDNSSSVMTWRRLGEQESDASVKREIDKGLRLAEKRRRASVSSVDSLSVGEIS